MDTLVKHTPEATHLLGSGSYRSVYRTTDPLLVRKVEYDNYFGHNLDEIRNYEEGISQNEKFRVASCWLADDGSNDVIMEFVRGDHLQDHYTGAVDCPGTGHCAQECLILAAEEFWAGEITDIHEENIIVDAAGVVWAIDYSQ